MPWDSISYKIACVSKEDPDQPAHLHILSRTSVIHLNKAWIFGYTWSAKKLLKRAGLIWVIAWWTWYCRKCCSPAHFYVWHWRNLHFCIYKQWIHGPACFSVLSIKQRFYHTTVIVLKFHAPTYLTKMACADQTAPKGEVVWLGWALVTTPWSILWNKHTPHKK